MGNHFLSRRQYEMTKPISLLGHLALLVVLFAAIFDNVKVNASPMDPLKRGRSASSLIPFPRVGRSDPTWGSARGMENFYGGDRPSSRDYETMQAIQNFLRELQIDN